MRDGTDLKILGELLSTAKDSARMGPRRLASCPRVGSVSRSPALPSRQEAGPKQAFGWAGPRVGLEVERQAAMFLLLAERGHSRMGLTGTQMTPGGR